MIEILKRGTKQIADCKLCGCQFSYEAEDIQRADTEQFLGAPIQKQYVICPQCKNEVVLIMTRSAKF